MIKTKQKNDYKFCREESYIKEAVELFISETTCHPVKSNDFNIIFTWQDKNQLLENANGSMVIEPTKEGNWYSSKNFGSSGAETPNHNSRTVGFSSYDLFDKYKANISTELIIAIVLGSIGTIAFQHHSFLYINIVKNLKKIKLVDN
ncbi:MAG: hypothetical protein HRS57_02080 [Mycoplasmataceae bacterium]|nr:hypothetical protein [Mycoplasmataceae bacterium]